MDIVEEIRQNPESGARRLAAEYKAGLMTLARRFCNDPGDAEELVNATFAAVVENIESHLEQASFFGWMCQILTSLHSRNVRRKSHGDIVYPGVVPDASDEKAQQEIYDNLDHSLVREAIGKLTKEERDLLIMHYFMEMPVAQMAKVLALPSGTVGDYFPPDAYTVTPIYDVFGEETKGATRSFAVSRVAPAFVITVR